MDRDEQRRIGVAGDFDPIVERNECVAVARHHHLVAAGRLEPALEFAREVEDEVFLDRAARAERAAVDAAMSGIEDDDGRARGRGAAAGAPARGEVGDRRRLDSGGERRRARNA